MTQKDKELLLIKDLCARLPYGVKIRIEYPFLKEEEWHPEILYGLDLQRLCIANTSIRLEEFKPYLIPLSSMDDELKNVIKWKLTTPLHDSFDEDSLEDLLNNSTQVVNYCYEHHLDINGLIERGLALEAPEGMYN